MKFMTFNVRYATPSDGEHEWCYRKDRVVARILEEAPELIGMQEVLPEMRAELDAGLGGRYQSVGLGRDSDRKGEQCPIFFRRDLFAVLEWTNFWLSDNPNVAGSRSWRALTSSPGGKMSLPRIATCLRLLSSRGAVWSVFNTHWDHQSAKARALSARLLLRHVKDALGRNERVVLMGDLNASENEECIGLLNGSLRSAFRVCNPEVKAPATYHEFQGSNSPQGCHIDYIFFDTGWRLSSCRVLAETGPTYLSDHFPLVAEALEA